ncbi:protein tilB homolog isoform X2 [Aplysia californica]|uniref:Protein tilB homolog isoform X2 n=1 Tax=Aplysia californica TaxID=6500 RepID=A0ABM0JR47_APLCA|nr:protein tilB homolog isoform X2 [Aplysia californica]
MVRITEDLVRKRAEHNELQISSLEEVSLHQQDIERLEHLDKWCRELKILYLQSNLIPKIENVSRLKKLEYLNLALNNVEKVENLEGCESLRKLDLTVNFVGELTSVESLCNNYHFRELYLTGNPCSDFEHYREYVIGTLPQLQWLDGIQIEKSERIQAVQNLPFIRGRILEQQAAHLKKRAREKAEAAAKQNGKAKETDGVEGDENEESNKENKPGFDGRWYTDINERDKKDVKKEEKSHEEKVDEFWNEKTAYTPESRLEVHNHLQELKTKEEKKDDVEQKAPRKLFADDGRPYNINEPKLDFSLTEDDQNVLLDLAIFKHLDTSSLECDVQPTYVRLKVRGKIFQLELPVEVNGDDSSAKRSQTTGHLLVSMPKVKQIIRPKTHNSNSKVNKASDQKGKNDSNFLEVDASARKAVDVTSIVADNEEKKMKAAAPFGSQMSRRDLPERENSADFVDDPDVPPLL